MNVTLKPELEKIINEEVKAGRSADLSEFVNRAVYHYIVAHDLGEHYPAEEIARAIDEGLEDLEKNDVIDGEEAFRQLRAHSAERRRQSA